MDVQLTDDQNKLIQSIARFEGFTDFDLETKSGSMKGDGYLGIITTVTIKNGKKKLDLILKSSQTNAELRKQAPIREAYVREIFLYGKVFPEFKKFQIENGSLNPFATYAKYYGGCEKENSECLVLENLKVMGYKLWNRQVPMNADHVALVFAQYGKFHSVSLALRHKNPELFNKLSENLYNVFEKTFPREMWEPMINNVLETGAKAVAKSERATEAFKRFSVDIKKFMLEEFTKKDDHLVITHGDCWCNNMMFKYEDPQNPTKPTKICLIDWQIASTGSPVMDLAYFFCSCSSKEVLYDYKNLLKIYHKNISDNLSSLSCDVEEIFPYELLEKHWKKYIKYGLYLALMICKVMVSDADEVPDFAEVAESGKNMLDGLNFESVHVNDYNDRIVDIVIFLEDIGMI